MRFASATFAAPRLAALQPIKTHGPSSDMTPSQLPRTSDPTTEPASAIPAGRRLSMAARPCTGNCGTPILACTARPSPRNNPNNRFHENRNNRFHEQKLFPPARLVASFHTPLSPSPYLSSTPTLPPSLSPHPRPDTRLCSHSLEPNYRRVNIRCACPQLLSVRAQHALVAGSQICVAMCLYRVSMCLCTRCVHASLRLSRHGGAPSCHVSLCVSLMCLCHVSLCVSRMRLCHVSLCVSLMCLLYVSLSCVFMCLPEPGAKLLLCRGRGARLRAVSEF